MSVPARWVCSPRSTAFALTALLLWKFVPEGIMPVVAHGPELAHGMPSYVAIAFFDPTNQVRDRTERCPAVDVRRGDRRRSGGDVQRTRPVASPHTAERSAG